MRAFYRASVVTVCLILSLGWRPAAAGETSHAVIGLKPAGLGDEPDWEEIQNKVDETIRRMKEQTERLRSRLPELQEEMNRVGKRLPELHAAMRRARREAKKGLEQARKALEISRKSIRERAEMLRNVGPVATMAMADWGKEFKGRIARTETQKEFLATNKTFLTVITKFATVDVRGEDRETILVQTRAMAGGATEKEAQRNLETIRLSIEERGNEIRIRSDLDDIDRAGDIFRRGEVNIILPRFVRIEIQNQFGSVRVERLENQVRIKNGLAPTEIKNTTGELKIETEFSDVVLSNHSGKGDIKNNFGDVAISGWSGPLDVVGSYTPVEVSDLRLEGDISIKTQFAPIVLHLPRRAHCDISAKTSFATIRTDFPVEGKTAGTELEATLGEGGCSIELMNDFGDIRIIGKDAKVSGGSFISKAPFELEEVSGPKINIPRINIPEITIPAIAVPGSPEPPAPPPWPEEDDSPTYREEWTIPLVDLEKVEEARLEHDHGNITVVGSATGPFRINAKKRIWAASVERAREVADQYRLHVTISGPTLKIEGLRPEKTPPGVKGAAVDYTLNIPKNINLEIIAEHGDLDIRNMRSDVRIEHGHGNIVLEDIVGNIESESAHGNLKARKISDKVEIEHDHGDIILEDVSGVISCESDHGKLEADDFSVDVFEIDHDHGEVTIRNLIGKLDCTNRHGDTTLDVTGGPLVLEYSHGNARVVSAPDLNGEWRINGEHGNCYLVLPGEAAADLSVRTSHGRIASRISIELEREGTRESGKLQLRGGGVPITVTVDHGDIHID